MSNDAREGMMEQVGELRDALERIGIIHHDSDDMTLFECEGEPCMVFVSTEPDQGLFVWRKNTYGAYVSSHEEALRFVGLGVPS